MTAPSPLDPRLEELLVSPPGETPEEERARLAEWARLAAQRQYESEIAVHQAERRCETCPAWKRLNLELGHCHRRAKDPICGWPVTDAADWCWDYVPPPQRPFGA